MSTDQKKALVRRMYREIDSGRIDYMEEIFAPDCRIQMNGSPPMDRTEFKQFAAAFYAGFPDLVHEVQDQIAEGDQVVSRLQTRGTQHGEFQGIPPTGRRVSVGAVSIYRFADSRIVEGWIGADILGLLQQIGAVPMPAAAAV